MAISVKVPFITSVATRCLCCKCPVQSGSSCVKDKMPNVSKAVKSFPLKREEIPGAYCSSGTASCSDIDASQACICGNCPVFTEYRLANSKPIGYYCRDGSAHMAT